MSKEKNVEKLSNAYYLEEVRKLEEEIGISVVDFFKLREAEKIYLPRFKAYYEVEAVDLKLMEIIVSNKKKIPVQHTVKIKNFSKTWLFKKGE